MNTGIQWMEDAYPILMEVALIILAVLMFACLIRSIIGPRVADRVISVNMIGSMVMVIIALLAVWMKEGYLADICIIYACLSFLAVVVLCKVYQGVYLERKEKEEEEKKNADDSNH